MWNWTLASLVGKDTDLISEGSSRWEVRLDKWDKTESERTWTQNRRDKI